MYFRGADLFEDESEGLHAQIRQSYFIACWYLGLEEQVSMWRSYAKGNGVAIRPTYRRLTTVLDALEAEDKARSTRRANPKAFTASLICERS
ncbi:MAG: hypothetical protein ABIS29_07000 [Vicinamibacterales bacterium]